VISRHASLCGGCLFLRIAGYGELKLMLWWDPLRGDPRFEKIVEESKQPIALK